MRWWWRYRCENTGDDTRTFDNLDRICAVAQANVITPHLGASHASEAVECDIVCCIKNDTRSTVGTLETNVDVPQCDADGVAEEERIPIESCASVKSLKMVVLKFSQHVNKYESETLMINMIVQFTDHWAPRTTDELR